MAAEIRFVIIANPRTGSNHLIDLLNSHQDVTCHNEVFHRNAVYIDDATRPDLLDRRNEDPVRFMSYVYESCRTRACGFKIFGGQNEDVLERVLRDRDIRKIVLYRHNALAVFSSDMIAEAEGLYLIKGQAGCRIDEGADDRSRTRAKATFGRELFEDYWRAYLNHYRHVIEVLNDTNQGYLFLTYEDFINENLLRRVFPFLDLCQPKKLRTRMKKMNTGDILSRFVNPDDVRAYMAETGTQNWAQETFMLWPQLGPTTGGMAAGRTEPGQPGESAVAVGVRNRESGACRGLSAGEIPPREPIREDDEKRESLLFIDYAVPRYDMFAGSRTNFMYLALMVKMGLRVKFLPADFRRVEPYSSQLRALGIEILDGEWYRNNWENWLRENGRLIDYVFYYRPNPAMKFWEAVKRYTEAAIIYQCCDLHYLRLQREASVKNDEAIRTAAGIYEKTEDFLLSNSDVLLTFSEMEEKIIREKFPHKRAVTVPLFFYENVPPPDRDFGKRRDLLFIGGFAHAPNGDAVTWFCAEVLPLILREVPDITFNVAGSDPPAEILALKSKHVRVLGKVSEEKLKELYRSVRLVVVPLRFGAGVKGKTVEALYYGVPIVSTSIGLEGIKGISQILAPQDDPAGFADEVISLYRDEERLRELSGRESAFVREAFTSEKTAELMGDILSFAKKEAAGREAPSPAPPAPAEIPRLIAFYLPQYHPIPENDEWWGKGFTEWRNVTKAEPRFPGHYQPHIPADLGFYDLRLEETRIAQAEMAREYGIYGFCYYHYWFNGKRLLERPLEDMLKSGKPDFPFCLCWANENWTRRWDGKDGDVLMEVEYSEEDDRRHIRELFRVFKDDRYIRVNGKPLFLVYRTENMPDPKRTAEVWREEARKAGMGELYLVRVESQGQCDPRGINFDAALEFAPDWNNYGFRFMANNKADARLAGWEIRDDLFDKDYILGYKELADAMMQKKAPDFRWFRCATPSWDNSARRAEGAVIFLGSTPAKYKSWLKHAIDHTKKSLSGDERIVFINAWNEWAEGNHLEPDQKFGRAYLEATRQALEEAVYITSGRAGAAGWPSAGSLEGSERKGLFPEIGRLLTERQREIDEMERRLAAKEMLLVERNLQASAQDARIRALLGSASWRVTGPLRRIHEMISKLRRRQESNS